MESLERWLIRETVRKQLSSFLNGSANFDEASTSSLVSKIFAKLKDFPPFRNDGRMQDALLQLFRMAPKVEVALKARKGTTSLERFFVSIVASPIISSVRARHAYDRKLRRLLHESQQQEAASFRESQRNLFAETGSALLEGITTQQDGVKLFLEELKCAHSINELRPSLQAFLATMRDNWTWKFLHAMKQRPQEFRNNFYRLPKQTILNALRVHAGDAATSAAVHILFAKPFGMVSIWQRFLSEAVNLESNKSELERVCSFLSPPCRAALTKHLDSIHREIEHDGGEDMHDNATGYALAQRTIVLNYIHSQFPEIKLVTEPAKWAALRFVELSHKIAGLQVLVDTMGSDEFAGSLRVIFSSSKSKLADSLLAKGSGLIKCVEELFECVEQGIALAEGPLREKDEDLQREFSRMWEKVQVRGITVVHNVLLNDPDLVVHQTLFWLIDLYKSGQKMNLPTWEVLSQMIPSDEERKEIAKEAEQVKAQEINNLKRKLGTKKIPVPKLDHAAKLVDVYCKVFEDEVDAFEPKIVKPDDVLYWIAADSFKTPLPVVDIQVNWVESQSALLNNRGFTKCGSTRSVSVWQRSVSGHHTTLLPITAIEVSPTYKDDDGWITLPRNLNKGAFGAPRIFLRYKRDQPTSDTKSHVFLLALRFVDANDEENKALGTGHWTLLAKFRNSLFYETRVWALFG